MNSNDKKGTGDPGQPGQLEDRLADAFEQNITRRENAVIDDEAAILSRELCCSKRTHTWLPL